MAGEEPRLVGYPYQGRVGPLRPHTGTALVMAGLATLGADTPRPVFAVLLCLLGTCVGGLFMSAQNTAFATVPAARTSDATTVLNMQRQTAGAFGVAPAGALLAGLGSGAGSGAVTAASAYRVGFLAMAALGVAAASASLFIDDRAVQDAHGADADADADRGADADVGTGTAAG